jgi:signal transduction histidine kinase
LEAGSPLLRPRGAPRLPRFADLGFRYKLLVLFGVGAIAPLLFAGVFAYASIAKAATEKAESEIAYGLEKARILVERRSEEIERAARSVAADNLVNINLDLFLDEAVRRYLSDFAATQSLDFIGIVEPDGRIRVDGSADGLLSRLVDSLEPGALERSSRDGALRFAAIAEGGGDGAPVFVLGAAVPVAGARSFVVAGVRAVREPPRRGFLDSLRETAGLPVLVAADGAPIAYSDGEVSSIGMARANALAEVDEADRLRVTVGKEPYLFRFMAVSVQAGKTCLVGLGLLESGFLAARDGAMIGFLAIMLCAFALCWVLAAVFSRRVTRPLNDMVDVARRIAEEDFEAEVPVEARDEIGTLAGEFNFMSRRLKESLAALRAEVAERRKAEAEVVVLNQALETRIAIRTRELLKANRELEQTIRDLEAARGQLVDAEKLAALGQLVASIAHEINTPLGAIMSSSESLAACLKDVLVGLPAFASSLAGGEREVFDELFARAIDPPSIEGPLLPRPSSRALEESLARAGIAQASDAADELAQIGVESLDPRALAVLAGATGERMLDLVEKAAWVSRSRQIIALAADKAAKTIRALKSYARQDSGGEVSEFDLRDEIDSILSIYYGKIKLGVEIRKDYREVPRIQGRRDSLSQVWFNLINNALQAMGYKGVLEVAVYPEGEGMIGASFTDDGPGVAEENRQKIFEAFFTTKPPGEGSGLGLSIAKKTVEAHGGRIWFESRPGRTTFTVRLPVGASGAIAPPADARSGS